MSSEKSSSGKQDITSDNVRTQGSSGNYPGYPPYPASEDITRKGNNNGKVSTEQENLELPDVSDIPGQEHISPSPLGELADVTVSSADEEDLVSGDSLDRETNDETAATADNDSNVSKEELKALDASEHNRPMADKNADHPDNTDADGTPLNELNEPDDLDIAGAELDDANEKIGEEDEENNYYSLGSEDNDELTEGTP